MIKERISKITTVASYIIALEAIIILGISKIYGSEEGSSGLIDIPPSWNKLLLSILIIFIRSYLIVSLMESIEEKENLSIKDVFTSVPLNAFLISLLMNLSVIITEGGLIYEDSTGWGFKSTFFNISLNVFSSVIASLIYFYTKN